MSSSTATGSSGVGFIGLLTIVFIILKLTGVIAWSWLWVLSPMWISLALSLLALTAFVLIVTLVKSRRY